MPLPYRSTRLLDETVFAVRNENAPGWQMLAWECEPEDLPRRLAASGLDKREHRLVGAAQVAVEFVRQLVVEKALKAGWHQDWSSETWFPMDQPLPRLPGIPVPADVSLSLRSIVYGWICIAVEAHGKRLDLQIDDIHDSLVTFVRFIQILAAGGEPHAALAERATAHFVVQDGPDPHLCRFYLEVRRNGEAEIIDAITDREALLRQFRSLSTAIANHPCFAHHYVCHCCLNDAEYERASDAADSEWQDGVKAGQFPDDWDAAQEFAAARIVAEVPLPEDCALLADEERMMLRALAVPLDRLLGHGLVCAEAQAGEHIAQRLKENR
ncbi:hypothetical protein [Mesorhizobium sp. L-8-10]|uniref:hypothetical protein n=1 Tax=Mesorhizobium sp. L-8-10 TaxID=2744523 RepID=UPI001928CEC8|nr:hypothetical protein [Mesorhizobium sp. L-8-10]